MGFVADGSEVSLDHVVVVFNFFDELRRLTAEGGWRNLEGKRGPQLAPAEGAGADGVIYTRAW